MDTKTNNHYGLVTLAQALALEVPTQTIEVTAAAASQLGAWQVDQHVMALHESGHAIVGTALGLPIKSVDIKGRGHGQTENAANDDWLPDYMSASRMRAMMVMGLAGWAAEREVIGEASNGSSSDLRKATAVALEMIESGLLESAPFISHSAFSFRGSLGVPAFIQDEFGRALMLELNEAKAKAIDLAAEHHDRILAFARIVAVRRRLTDAELLEAIRSTGIEPVPLGD